MCWDTVGIATSATIRWTVGVCALATLGASSTAGATENACQVEKRARAATHHAHHGRPPLVIGDSTTLLAVPTLGRLGLEADAHGCRQFSAGVALLRARVRSHTLPRLSILALGANGPISVGNITATLKLIGRRRVLALVTPRHSPASTAAMHAAARRYRTRVLLIDWASFSAPHTSWFAGDGLHVGNAGAVAYAGFIRRSVRAFVDQPVRALHLPTHRAGTLRCSAVHPSGSAIRVYVLRGRSRITCALARRLVVRRALRPIAGWRFYDWSMTRNGPWSRVYVRHDHRVVVAAITHGEL